MTIALALACAAPDSTFSSSAEEIAAPASMPQRELAPGDAADGAMAEPEMMKVTTGAARAAAPRPAPSRAKEAAKGLVGGADMDRNEGTDAADAEASVREWFPDAFLWVPIVETDDDGLASLEVTVPDSLTDWRVLGLAHDMEGQQAGAVHSFASRLPVSVDLALPAQLRTGDQIDLPVRAVNGTTGPLSASLQLSASGSLQGSGGGTASLSAGGVSRQTVRLSAVRAGEGTLRASVQGGGERDQVQRTVRVVPLGTPVQEQAGGVVADRMALTLAKPAGGGPDEELEVTVFPGPLALLQGELERLSTGGRTELPGYGLALTNQVATVAEAAGVELDEALARRVRLLAWQGVVRTLGSADPQRAVDLLHAVGPTESLGGVEAVRPALVARVVQAQRPDGTWSWQGRSTLQRVVVDTIHAARSLPEEQAAARLLAQGACERHAPAVAADPYTAAMLVGSGMLEGPTAEPLLTTVREALVRDEDGVPTVAVPADVVDAWGARPARAEMLAWTVLALPADDPDRGPLAAELVSQWSPTRGLGAGRADEVVLEAILASVPGVSGPTEVALEVDGEIVSRATLDPAKPREAAHLQARPGKTQALVLDPPVAGVAFSATRTSWVPLDPKATLPGVEVEVSVPKALRAGDSGSVLMTLAGPRGTRLTLVQSLPSGAVVDVDALRRDSDVASVELGPDRVTIQTQPFAAAAMEVALPVTPAFGGRFSTDPLLVRVDTRAPVALPSLTWTVQP